MINTYYDMFYDFIICEKSFLHTGKWSGRMKVGLLTLYHITLSFPSSVIFTLMSEITSELLNPWTINTEVITSSEDVPLHNIF